MDRQTYWLVAMWYALLNRIFRWNSEWEKELRDWIYTAIAVEKSIPIAALSFGYRVGSIPLSQFLWQKRTVGTIARYPEREDKSRNFRQWVRIDSPFTHYILVCGRQNFFLANQQCPCQKHMLLVRVSVTALFHDLFGRQPIEPDTAAYFEALEAGWKAFGDRRMFCENDNCVMGFNPWSRIQGLISTPSVQQKTGT